MKKEENNPFHFNSLTEGHRAFGLPDPQHPLISLLNAENNRRVEEHIPNGHVLHFYKISFKPELSGRVRYGQSYYDFEKGGLLFAAPGQIIGGKEDHDPNVCSSYTVLIHPDFLLGYSLAKKIKQYGFFSYASNEALHLSDKEKDIIIGLFKIIEEELSSRIDDFSHDVIIAQIELFLNYANRFYKRQFITRKAVNHTLLEKLEDLVEAYFNSDSSLKAGLPTVNHFAEQLHISPHYLSDLLRSLLGLNAQQYIHSKLIEKAKEKLSTTSLSVSEIAYELGFEHSQSFSKLFKTKTKQSPLEFRQSFN